MPVPRLVTATAVPTTTRLRRDLRTGAPSVDGICRRRFRYWLPVVLERPTFARRIFASPVPRLSRRTSNTPGLPPISLSGGDPPFHCRPVDGRVSAGDGSTAAARGYR